MLPSQGKGGLLCPSTLLNGKLRTDAQEPRERSTQMLDVQEKPPGWGSPFWGPQAGTINHLEGS